MAILGFEIDVSNSDLLCSDDMILDLLTEVEDFSGSLYDSSDKLAELKVLAKSHLEELTGKKILWKDITLEAHDGNQKNQLYLKHKPILSVTLAKKVVQGVTTVFVANTDFWIYREYLHFKQCLPYGHKNIFVSYRAGIHNQVTSGNTVSNTTARVISLVAARHVIIDISSGPSEGSSITAGPVSLKENFGADGQFAPKLARMSEEISAWVKGKGGVRLSAVGKQRYAAGLRRYYDIRSDSFIDY